MLQESISLLRRQFLGLSRVLSTITELVSGTVQHRDEDSLLLAATDLLLHNHNFQHVTIHKVLNGDLILQTARSTRSLLSGDIDESTEPFVHTSTVIAEKHLQDNSLDVVTREVADTFFYSVVIAHDNEVIGVITVNSPSFDDNHAKFLPVFATTLGSLLLNVRFAMRLNEDVERRSIELESAWETANKSDAAKAKFLTNVSHEYLTPLNSINNASTLLFDSNLNDEQKELVRTIMDSTHKLSGMVGGTLDYVLSETGQMDRSEECIDLIPVLEGVLTQAQRLNVNPHLSIQFRRPKSLPLVEVDQKRISQILNHLMSNAIKFTAEGSVTLEAQLMGLSDTLAEMQFLVIDTGIGIAESDQEEIFSAFHQLNSSSTRPYGGTGLGLALCQRLSNMMGSQIEVNSTPGIGSSFSFKLDLPVRQPAMSASKQRSLDDTVSVLLVEDNLINQKLAARLLEKMGCHVDIANDGVDAVSKFSESSYDLVFMDCQMPNMDGFEATSRIRELESGHRTPIIALTANCLPEDRARSFQVGMDEFLTKPVVKEQLRDALSRWTPNQAPN
jgi:signal transduction histidine kinase/ActR/RegA family two-component response regulator